MADIVAMTIEEAKSYLKIDGTDEDNDIPALIENSQIYIDMMVGENYKVDPKAVKLAVLLQQKLMTDMHDNRSTEVPGNTKTDRIVVSILDKLGNYEEVSV